MSGGVLMELPRCPVHGCQLEYRPGRTPEQRFCGTWYDCPYPGCAHSVLFPSEELQEIYRAAYRKKATERVGAAAAERRRS